LQSVHDLAVGQYTALFAPFHEIIYGFQTD
jgi:hypothetical protein